jgi:hypothetical protein
LSTGRALRATSIRPQPAAHPGYSGELTGKLDRLEQAISGQPVED